MREFQSAAAPDSDLYAAALQQRKEPARTAALHFQQCTTAAVKDADHIREFQSAAAPDSDLYAAA